MKAECLISRTLPFLPENKSLPECVPCKWWYCLLELLLRLLLASILASPRDTSCSSLGSLGPAPCTTWSISTEWIFYSNVGGLNLSWKDSDSNPFRRTQVYLSRYIYIYISVYIYVCVCVYIGKCTSDVIWESSLSHGASKTPISLSLFHDLTAHYNFRVLKCIQMKNYAVWIFFNGWSQRIHKSTEKLYSVT